MQEATSLMHPPRDPCSMHHGGWGVLLVQEQNGKQQGLPHPLKASPLRDILAPPACLLFPSQVPSQPVTTRAPPVAPVPCPLARASSALWMRRRKLAVAPPQRAA